MAGSGWWSGLFKKKSDRQTRMRAPHTGDSTVWKQGQVILGEYVVEGELGEGGMGTVYLLVRSQSTGHRFAVKKTRIRDEETQINFLSELQTWLDLPEHPYLVACRFFRTVGEELAIFAEYVEGGSLEHWIAERRLTQLEQILDVAIQFAWGLHAAHELRLVHQDVKPGNVLMSPEGAAKVSDFGLARARAAAGERDATGGQSILVSYAGRTEAYCSPEQGSRRAQAVADLAAYEEARRIYERLVAKGRRELESELAALCVNKAFIHKHLDDAAGALALYDRALAIRERLVHQEGRRELANDLARTYQNKALALRALGDLAGAVGSYDRGLAIYERLVEQEEIDIGDLRLRFSTDGGSPPLEPEPEGGAPTETRTGA